MNVPSPNHSPALSTPILNMKNITLGLEGGKKKVPPSPLAQTQAVETRWITSKARLLLQTPSGWCKSHGF